MRNVENFLNEYEINHQVSEDFEHRVYAKISKKKRQRKVVYSFSFVLILLTVFMGYQFLNMGTEDSNPFHIHNNNTLTKEEIPLLEDLYFSTYDSRTNYAYEQVALKSSDNEI